MSSKRGFYAMTPWIVAGCLVILALGFSPAPTLAGDPSPNAFGKPTSDNWNPGEDITAVRGTRPTGWKDQTRSEILARNGVVATSEPLAAQAGLKILQDGGNAVDAAVATMAMLALVEPNSCGLGAEMFAIIYDAKTKQLYQISANGPSPQNYTLELFEINVNPYTGQLFDINGPPYGTAPNIGIFSAMVPGSVDGWDKMLKRFGTLSFKEVLEPARKYAFEGFPVHEVLANSFRGSKGNLCATDLPYDMDTKAVYCADGDVPGLYEIFKNPDMGHTFEVLQKKGVHAFYKGEIAQAIVNKANSLGVNVPGGGPFWTMDDLKNYQARWERPLMTEYHGYNIWETPPPSQAWAALEMLNILDVCAEEGVGDPPVKFNLAALGRETAQFTHLEVEAKKLAYSDLLRWNADPDFSDIYDQINDHFNDKDWVRENLCSKIKYDQATPAEVTGNLDGGTIYGASADRWGNMVSFVYSVYTSWGSKITIPGYGFQLSSRGGMFNFDPLHPNVLAGTKRPFITIIAGFITKDKDGYPDGEPIMAFGNMGGGTQPQAHVQHIVNLIDLGYNVQATGDAARFDHDQGTGVQGRDNLRLDYYLFQAIGAELRDVYGHHFQDGYTGSFGLAGGYQGILFERDYSMPEPKHSRGHHGHHGHHGKDKDYQGPVNGVYRAGSELRKDGCAVGW